MKFLLQLLATVVALGVASCAQQEAFAQAQGCVSIPRADRPVEAPLSPGAMAEGFASGGPVIFWRPLAQQLMEVIAREFHERPVVPYRAIVVTERRRENNMVMDIYLLSVNLDGMCFAGEYPIQDYWDWREALVGRPA